MTTPRCRPRGCTCCWTCSAGWPANCSRRFPDRLDPITAAAMTGAVRSWECPCGAAHDRDVNAAINILAAGRADRLNACGGTVRPAA
ncbi:zinc ribbon domain-containing protein [Microbispora rosea]|uniref:zinc ribbon domain-containing protein n=1 Tax=Microbispora rosea TaxID=58117 RepID=UPI003D91DB60